MEYQVTTLLISFVVGVVMSFIILPILRKLKIGQTEREDGPQSHLKKQGTPTMGGIIMEITIILMTLGWCIFYGGKEPGIIQRLIPLVLVSLGFGLIGFIDDFKKLVFKNTEGLKPSYKMLGLLVISVSFVIYLCKVIGTDTLIPIWKHFITLPIWLYIPFAIFVMLGTTNAVITSNAQQTLMMMIPQALPESAKLHVTINLTTGGTKTLEANIGGGSLSWGTGQSVTYKISSASINNVLNITRPGSYGQNGGTNRYSVESYKWTNDGVKTAL